MGARPNTRPDTRPVAHLLSPSRVILATQTVRVPHVTLHSSPPPC